MLVQFCCFSVVDDVAVLLLLHVDANVYLPALMCCAAAAAIFSCGCC